MDRARVLCPSISFAVHVTGAAMLMVAPLLMADRLPVPPPGTTFGPSIELPAIARLGGPPALGGPRPVRPRVEPRPTRVVAPPSPSFAGATAATDLIDLGGGGGIPGAPESEGTGPGGLCLTSCGSGEGDGNTIRPAAVFPEVERAGPVRAGRGGVVREPRKLRHVAPVYPPLAIAVRARGRVVLDCVIDREGRIGSVTVLSGHPLLEPAAVEAVRQWRYTPTLLDGSPVSVLLTVTVEFKLR